MCPSVVVKPDDIEHVCIWCVFGVHLRKNMVQTNPYLLKHGTPTLPHHRKKLANFYFCAIHVCYTQVSGPAQATCSNTLSSTRTRHFHTTPCAHNPTKD